MRGLQIVDGYTSALTLRETQKAIKLVKDTFANELAAALNLERVSAPFIVRKGSAHKAFPQLKKELATDVFFVTTQELEDMYPDKTPKEREDIIAREKGVVFVMQIGDLLKSGIKHDGRAPDYDDWKLNGDLLFWNETLRHAFEVSSMGIRVDSESLAYQLKAANAEDRMKYDYHKGIADGTLPLTIGGGIGQSRLSMLILEKAHIGEVQVSLWPDKMVEDCKNNGINLL